MRGCWTWTAGRPGRRSEAATRAATPPAPITTPSPNGGSRTARSGAGQSPGRDPAPGRARTQRVHDGLQPGGLGEAERLRLQPRERLGKDGGSGHRALATRSGRCAPLDVARFGPGISESLRARRHRRWAEMQHLRSNSHNTTTATVDAASRRHAVSQQRPWGGRYDGEHDVQAAAPCRRADGYNGAGRCRCAREGRRLHRPSRGPARQGQPQPERVFNLAGPAHPYRPHARGSAGTGGVAAPRRHRDRRGRSRRGPAGRRCRRGERRRRAGVDAASPDDDGEPRSRPRDALHAGQRHDDPRGSDRLELLWLHQRLLHLLERGSFDGRGRWRADGQQRLRLDPRSAAACCPQP